MSDISTKECPPSSPGSAGGSSQLVGTAHWEAVAKLEVFKELERESEAVIWYTILESNLLASLRMIHSTCADPSPQELHFYEYAKSTWKEKHWRENFQGNWKNDVLDSATVFHIGTYQGQVDFNLSSQSCSSTMNPVRLDLWSSEWPMCKWRDISCSFGSFHSCKLLSNIWLRLPDLSNKKHRTPN